MSNQVNRTAHIAAVVDAFSGALADAARVGLSPTGAGVLDLRTRGWVMGDGDLPPGFDENDGSAEHSELVVRIDGNYHLVARGGDLDLVDVANFVQDWAIDELGLGWPELKSEAGTFITVLSPAMDGERLVWRGAQGDAFADTGELHLD